jgi:DNA-binding NarL/FixJ family response regulator
MAHTPIRVMLVDDRDEIAPGLRLVLAGEPDIDLVAVASTAAQAVAVATAARPDVIVMDADLSDGSGMSTAARIRSENPDINVVLRTGSSDGEAFRRAVRAGCAGCIDRSRPFDTFAAAIRNAATGHAVISAEALRRLVPRSE